MLCGYEDIFHIMVPSSTFSNMINKHEHMMEPWQHLPEGDTVEVLSELCQVRTFLLILLFRPQQDLWKLDG